MKNYNIYTIIFLLLTFASCSPTHKKEIKVDSPSKDRIKPCTREYIPVCGEVQIECITTPCKPIKKTFPNACVLGNNKRAKFLHKGACR